MKNKELLFDSFRVDYTQIGKLRFRVFNDLLGAEAGEMEQFQRQQSQAVLGLVSVSRRLAEVKGITFDEAYALITSGDANNAQAMMEVADECALLMASMPSETAMDDQIITLMIQSRAEIETDDGWAPLEDWQVADTRRLPRGFRAKIRAFIDLESNGGKQPEQPAKKALKPVAKASAE